MTRNDDLEELVEVFNDTHGCSIEEQALVLSEESGEVCEAVNSLLGNKLFKPDGTKEDVKDELADVIYTCYSIAYLADIDGLDERVKKRAEWNLNRSS